MFTLEFLGAEIGHNLKFLVRAGVKHVGFSFHRFNQREKKSTKKYGDIISSRFPEDVSVHLHPGIPADFDDDLESFAAMYEAFVIANLTRLDSVTEIDRGTPIWIYQQRKAFYDQLEGPFFRPVWHAKDGYAALQNLADKYQVVAIPQETVESETTLSARVRSLQALYSTSFHGLGMGSPSNLRSIPFTSASSMSWLAPQLRGETVVWDGGRLHRFPKTKKDQVRSRYRQTFERAGFDPDLIAKDDYNEVIAATIWAYLQLEKNVSERRGDRPFTVIDGEKGLESSELAAHSGEPQGEEIAAQASTEVDKIPSIVRHVPVPRDATEMAHLPTLNLETQQIIEQSEHGPVLRDITVPRLGTATLRQCDTCFVAANCPAVRPKASCAFNLPIEVRTKDQLRALLQAIIEMQGQRVAFARFSEELQGGYPDPVVSSEMDRLFKLVEQLKKMEENREFIKITAERHASGGVLSALFGDRATAAQALPHGGYDADATNTIVSRSLD